MFPRILIISTTTYRPDDQSRAADTYFHNWPKTKLIHLFSSSRPPIKGLCSSYFQITDSDMLKKFFFAKKPIGKIYNNDDLESVTNEPSSKKQSFIDKFKKKNWLRFYLRKTLWSKKRWLTKELEKWVDDFKPEIIYCGVSDDYFIMDISYYFSLKYSIPLIVTIGDDYYFDKSGFFLGPYKHSYRALFDKIMDTKGFGVYISNKTADKYNSYFNKQGFPVYLASEIQSIKYKKIIFEFNYFGNINLGRHKSLAYLGKLLQSIDKSYVINVYCNTPSKRIRNYLNKNNCLIHNPLPYEDVKRIMNSGSFNIVASGFETKNIEKTRYSLSTKIADCLASSGPIIGIGPEGDGAIDYLKERDCAILISDKNDWDKNKVDIEQKITDFKYLNSISKKAKLVYQTEHNLESNRHKFEEQCANLIETNE